MNTIYWELSEEESDKIMRYRIWDNVYSEYYTEPNEQSVFARRWFRDGKEIAHYIPDVMWLCIFETPRGEGI